jgi:hypothetical protein
MKKLIITEEERSRILGMHQSTTVRQYLMEATGYDNTQGPNVNDGPAAYNYFMGIVKKTKTLKKGTTFLGKNTYWVVTSDWVEATQEQMGIDGYRSDILMRGIVKRSYYFDVSNDSESIAFVLAKTNADSYIFPKDSGQNAKFIPRTQTLVSEVGIPPGAPGGNMGLVGGLTNFKAMVKNLPGDVLKNFNLQRQQNPKFGDDIIPADQKDLYGLTSTKTPQKP